jgi:hypothetical protein
MTGAEHYREAENLLLHVQEDLAGHVHPSAVAVAQVHATLAVAACLGLSAHLPMPDQQAWNEAAGQSWGPPDGR